MFYDLHLAVFRMSYQKKNKMLADNRNFYAAVVTWLKPVFSFERFLKSVF